LQIAAVGLFLGICSLAFWLGRIHYGHGRENGGLEIPQQHLDFGSVWAQHDFQMILELRNTSNQMVEVSGFLASCACVSIEPSSVVLAPGDSTQLRATPDLTTKRVLRSALSQVPYVERIVPQIVGARTKPRGWTLKGQVQLACTVSPTRWHFVGALSARESEPARDGLLVVRPLTHVDTVRAHSDSHIVKAIRVTDPKSDGSEFHVHLTPNERLAAGSYAGRIAIVPILRDQQTLPPTLVDVTLCVIGDICAVPHEVHLLVQRGEPRPSEQVVISSRSGTRFRVQNVKGQDSYLDLRLSTTGLRDTHVLQVSPSVSPPQRGRFEVSIALESETSKAVVLRLPVTVGVLNHGDLSNPLRRAVTE
jgi:hypothetical protein